MQWSGAQIFEDRRFMRGENRDNPGKGVGWRIGVLCGHERAVWLRLEEVSLVSERVLLVASRERSVNELRDGD